MPQEIPSITLGASWDGNAVKEGLQDLRRDLRGAGNEGERFNSDISRIGREAGTAAAAMTLFGTVTLDALGKFASQGPQTASALAQIGAQMQQLAINLDPGVAPFFESIQKGIEGANEALQRTPGAGEDLGGALGAVGLGGTAGLLAKFIPGLSRFALPVAAGVTGASLVGQSFEEENLLVKTLKAGAGGALLGGAIGSVVPGVGTGIGAAAGGIGGGLGAIISHFIDQQTNAPQGEGASLSKTNTVVLQADNVLMASTYQSTV